MAKEPAPSANPKWAPGAWTPKRCAVWFAMAEHLRKEFEAWVMAEAHKGEVYLNQILPEHEELLAETA